jgi:S-adenosylhomocysteine hydrolase
MRAGRGAAMKITESYRMVNGSVVVTEPFEASTTWFDEYGSSSHLRAALERQKFITVRSTGAVHILNVEHIVSVSVEAQ